MWCSGAALPVRRRVVLLRNWYRCSFALVIFSTGLSFSLIGAALPDITVLYGLTKTQASTLPFLQFLGAYLGLALLTIASSRPRLLLAGAAMVQCLAALYIALVPGYSLALKSCFFLFGAAGNIIVPLTGTIITKAGRGGAARDLNVHYGFFSAGVMAAPLYSGLLYNQGFHYGPSYMVLGAVAFAAFIAALLDALPETGNSTRITGSVFRQVFVSHGKFLLIILAVNILYVSAESIPNTWIPKYFTDVFPHYSSFRTRFVLTLFWGAITAGRYICALLLHRGAKPVTLMMSLSGAASICLFAAASSRYGLYAELLFTMLGLFLSGMFPLIASSFERLPEKYTDMSFVLLIATGMIGASGVSKLSGYIADQAGFHLAMKTGSIFLVFVLVVLAVWGVKYYRMR
jgi:fucose permease